MDVDGSLRWALWTRPEEAGEPDVRRTNVDGSLRWALLLALFALVLFGLAELVRCFGERDG